MVPAAMLARMLTPTTATGARADLWTTDPRATPALVCHYSVTPTSPLCVRGAVMLSYTELLTIAGEQLAAHKVATMRYTLFTCTAPTLPLDCCKYTAGQKAKARVQGD